MSDMASGMESKRQEAMLLCRRATALGRQEGGSHYKNMEIEPLSFCAANMTPEQIKAVVQQNTLKYIWRDKDDYITDLKKARHYIDWAIETLEGRIESED
jgi:hypothetical protein